MKRLILASHGRLAEGMADTARKPDTAHAAKFGKAGNHENPYRLC